MVCVRNGSEAGVCTLPPVVRVVYKRVSKELNALELGVEISERNQELSTLLYADDVVLITDSRKKLQRLLDTVTEYARKWRFELNPKKSEVVVFGVKHAPRNIEWRLGQHIIKQSTQYKYLGIELTRTLRWRPYIRRVLAKAKRNMTQALAMGVSGGSCPLV